MDNRRPNILFVTSDQHRKSSTGCYGNPDVKTPNLDRMAAEGIRFNESMVASPLCIPTRSTWQTGLYLHQHECGPGPGTRLGRFKGMGDYLNDAGYATCFVGKSHWHDPDEVGFVPPDQRMGWQEWYGTPPHDFYRTRIFNDDGTVRESFEGQYEPPLLTDWTTRFIDKQSMDQPWCVNLNYGVPHSVYGIDAYHDRPVIWKRIREVNEQYGFNIPDKWIRDDSRQIPQITCPQYLMFRVVPQEFLDMYDRETLTLEPDVDKKWYTLASYYYLEYYAMISALDREIGRLMNYLEASGRLENTVVIYTSDHGDLLCGSGGLRCKGVPRQNALRTPLLGWGPRGGIRAGQTCDALVNSVDMLPTILELAGVHPPSHLPGVSIASWMLGAEGPEQEAIFMELFGWRAVYDGHYLYPARPDKEKTSFKPLHLTDVKADPQDQVNLVDAPAHAAARNRLQAELDNHIKQETY